MDGSVTHPTTQRHEGETPRKGMIRELIIRDDRSIIIPSRFLFSSDITHVPQPNCSQPSISRPSTNCSLVQETAELKSRLSISVVEGEKPRKTNFYTSSRKRGPSQASISAHIEQRQPPPRADGCMGQGAAARRLMLFYCPSSLCQYPSMAASSFSCLVTFGSLPMYLSSSSSSLSTSCGACVLIVSIWRGEKHDGISLSRKESNEDGLDRQTDTHLLHLLLAGSLLLALGAGLAPASAGTGLAPASAGTGLGSAPASTAASLASTTPAERTTPLQSCTAKNNIKGIHQCITAAAGEAILTRRVQR
jgi:hypothetical protein